ncbi:Acyltransferase-like protein, chloroplastic [Glycine soja]
MYDYYTAYKKIYNSAFVNLILFLIFHLCRLHSAGHLLDIFLPRIRLGNLEPGKAYHFPDELSLKSDLFNTQADWQCGTISQNEMQSKQKDLELEDNALIFVGGKVSVDILLLMKLLSFAVGVLPDHVPKIFCQRWSPDAIVFNSNQVYETPSYRVQFMFRESNGATFLKSQLQTPDPDSVDASAILWKNLQDKKTYLKIKVHYAKLSQLSGSTDPLISDPVKMASVSIENKLPPAKKIEQLSYNITALLPCLPELADIIPRDTLLWKLKLLKSVVAYANSHIIRVFTSKQISLLKFFLISYIILFIDNFIIL